MESNDSLPSEQRTVYLVRHAESRYNAAVKSLNLYRIINGNDHAITLSGLDQCRELETAILNAKESNDEDAMNICNREITLSSPLCRSIETAILALPKVDGPVKLIPEGREIIHKGYSYVMRDSVGSQRSEIKSNLKKELSMKKCDHQNIPELDVSDLEGEVWWTLGESNESFKERIKRLLFKLYEISAQESATVFVGHSRVIRCFFQQCASKKLSETDIGINLQERFIQNCGVLRIKLKVLEEKGIVIEDADFLFGTGFKDSYKVEKYL